MFSVEPLYNLRQNVIKLVEYFVDEYTFKLYKKTCLVQEIKVSLCRYMYLQSELFLNSVTVDSVNLFV